MSDYISRQAAIDAIEEMQMPIMRSEFLEEQYVFTGMSEALRAIKDLPSADVRENVKGSLIEPYWEEYFGTWYHCSVCGSNTQGGKFCNECGADLRGVEDE